MKLKLLFFASLREQFGFSYKEITLAKDVRSPAEFLQLMSIEAGKDWIKLLKDRNLYKVAINQNLASWEAVINDGDELAIFPPITGG
jgi:molybdopterin synthase sulfur carrier subunit